MKMGSTEFFICLVSVLTTVQAQTADKNKTATDVGITFQSAYNVYLTQNIQSKDGNRACSQNQARPPTAQPSFVSLLESKEVKKMMSTLIETKLGNLTALVEKEIKESKRKQKELEGKLENITASISNINDYLEPKRSASVGTNLFDCHAVYRSGSVASGVYKIKPRGAPHPVDVHCDMSVDTEWTVIMARHDGSVSFDRTWADFKAGFGDVSKEHWLGLDTMHYLTNQDMYKVRFEMRKWLTKTTQWAEFNTFRIGSESSNYKLTIGGETGTATRGRMPYHNGKPFSSKDRDNDGRGDQNCADRYGGWWHEGCYKAIFTGPYSSRCQTTKNYKCLSWDFNQPLDRVVIKIARL